MNVVFSRMELASFFAAFVVLGAALYPSAYTRGLMHRREGDRSLAIGFFSRHLETHPNHKGATLALAEAYEEAGRPEEGVPRLLSFYGARRGDLEAGRAVLGLLERAGRRDEAAKFRWELIEDLLRLPRPPKRAAEELAYQAFQDAAARQDDAETLKALTLLARLGGAGYQDRMLRLLTERKQLDAAFGLLRGVEQTADVRRMLVRLHRAAGRDAAAVAAARDGLAAYPDDVGLLSDLAALHVAAKRWEAAEQPLRRLIRLQPAEPAWLRELAATMVARGRVDEGARVLEQLLNRDPSDRDRWWPLVYAYADRGRHADAAARLERYLERFPGDEEARRFLIHEWRLAERTDKAVAWLKARGRDEASRRMLLAILLEEERFDEAAAEYRALLSLRPDDPELYKGLAYVEQTRGDHKAAAESLEAYLARFPDDAKAADTLAGLYVELGQRPKAIELLRRHVR